MNAARLGGDRNGEPAGRPVSRRALLAGLATLGGLAACDGSSAPTGSGTGSGSPSAAESALRWGPTPEQLTTATQLVTDWPDAKLAGQVLVLTYDGTDPAEAAAAVTAVHAAGVIVMKYNVESGDQVRATAAAVQGALADDDRDFPAIVTVDQEGGLVARLGDLVPTTPTFMSAGAAIAGEPTRGAEVVQAAAAATGNLLRTLGFTWVFAPDADVTIGPSDPTIGSRSAGSDPALVSSAVTAAIAGYRAVGIGCSVKHFPGHGSVTDDSHTSLPRQSASLDDLRARDLVPFTAATQAGVPVMMMSHLAVDAIEPGVPCTLSRAAYETLRSETGFEGVVCTDAMNMQAITDEYGAGPAAAKAVIAGADLVLMPQDYRAAHTSIVDALADGSLQRSRLIDAAARVVALQTWLAEADDPPSSSDAVAEATRASQALSAAAITQVRGECGGAVLIESAVQVSGANPADRQGLVAAARAAGLSTDSGPMVVLATSQAPAAGDIVVALDTPYVLAQSSATAAFALYGRTPGSFAALVDVLTGTAQPPGRLPVTVEGLDALDC